ncbi:unnamed protein product, partial [Didymodactylos carnosus]
TYNYFNDFYSYCLDTFQWSQLKPNGQVPCPRSAAPLVTLIPQSSDQPTTMFIIGGYSKEKKENKDKGQVHQDVFQIQQQQGKMRIGVSIF